MEFLVAALIGGVVLAAAVTTVLWKVFSSAFDNGLDWLIHTFGNEQAAKRIEEKWRQQDAAKPR